MVPSMAKYSLTFASSIMCLMTVAPAAEKTADTIEVSTSGQARDTLSVPAAVHVVSAQHMQANNAWWIGETLNQMPGVYQAQLRGVIDVPSIRMPLSFKNHYLYLLDGVPVQSTVMFNSKAFAYSGATANPYGLEILKGPGSALYGSDAMSAVINVLSQPPSDVTSASVRAGGGMYGGRSLAASLGGPVSNQQAMNATVVYDGEDGWRDHSAWERVQSKIGHRVKIGATTIDTSIVATVLHSQMTGQLNQTVYSNNPTDDGLAPAVPLDEANDDATYVRVSSAVRTPIAAGMTLEVTPYVRDIDNSYMEVFNPATTPLDTEHTATAGSLQRVRWQPTVSTNIIIGADVEWTRLWFLVDQTRPTTVVGGLSSYQGPHYDFTVDSLIIAPYVQMAQWIGPRMLMEAGLRYDWATYDYDEHLGPTTDPNDLVYRPPSRTDEFAQLSPKAGITYLLHDTQSVFARYAHGFRLPAADSLYVLGNGQTSFILEPETVDAYEVGWKGQVDRSVMWEIDGYWVESRDGIVDNVVTPAGTISTNGGSRRYRGIEVGGQWSVRTDTDLGLSYARTWHEIIRYRSDGPSLADGKTPAKAPENLANARITHRPWETVSLTLEGQWLGSWYMDDLNTASTPNVVLVHARAAWAITRQWAIDGKILNLFDKSYAATAERLSFGDRYRPGQPFTAMVGVTWTY